MKLKLEFEFISMYYYLVISYVEFTVTRLSYPMTHHSFFFGFVSTEYNIIYTILYYIIWFCVVPTRNHEDYYNNI
jgi:hypothetical protein